MTCSPTTGYIIAPPPAPSSIRPPNTSQWECFSAYAEPPAGPSACPTAYNHPADEGRDHPGPGHILAKRCSSKTAMPVRSEEHTSELQSLMRLSYAVFCLKNKT